MSEKAPAYPKRLIEVDLPIARISAHARREKSIRHGHISTLHIWWARRPLAACRAVICAALWPDPADELCPPKFRSDAFRILADLKKRVVEGGLSPEQRDAVGPVSRINFPNDQTDFMRLRRTLLEFIAEFADWDLSTNKYFLETSRALTQSAHESLGGDSNSHPLVVDPFAGGGSIPLEALRVGADVYTSDINPVPVVINKILLDYVPRYGTRLSQKVRELGERVADTAKSLLKDYYPESSSDANAIACLWARTIKCEGPACGVEIPLFRSDVLDSAKNTRFSARATNDGIILDLTPVPPYFGATIKNGSVVCPRCQYVTPSSRARAQLTQTRAGLDNARLICVVERTAQGTRYRPPTLSDHEAVRRARASIQGTSVLIGTRVAPIPTAPISPVRPAPNSRGVSAVTSIGITDFSGLFAPRQLVSMSLIADIINEMCSNVTSSEDQEFMVAAYSCLACALGRLADYNNSLCTWVAHGGFIGHAFTKQALSNVWDFAEVVPFSGATGSFQGAVDWVANVLDKSLDSPPGLATVSLADARSQVLPDESIDLFVTDPPYYSEIPYADISDFFYIWMRASIGSLYPELFASQSVDRKNELVVTNSCEGVTKDKAYFETGFREFCESLRRATKPSGVGVIVFANTKTSAWEAMLQAAVDAGLQVMASWSIDTERASRTRARSAASLQSSIPLVCRPREDVEGQLRKQIGEWRDVIAELPKQVHSWMPRLASEGVVGADAIFACLGPALEVFSRYSRVEKSNGDVVPLREYLEHVWAAVSHEALTMIFKDADASGLEPDARLTAIWLWTLGTASPDVLSSDSENEDLSDDEEEVAKQPKTAGFILEFDAARKIAQGLGIHLEKSPSVVEVKGDKARLLPVAERTRYLFGKDVAEPTNAKVKPNKRDKQLSLFAALQEVDAAESIDRPELKAPQPGTTVLDRVHQAMILFAAGRGEALKRFLVEEGIGKDGRFWKLAQSLSALYPAGIDEKRWVDGVLARKKSLGL